MFLLAIDVSRVKLSGLILDTQNPEDKTNFFFNLKKAVYITVNEHWLFGEIANA